MEELKTLDRRQRGKIVPDRLILKHTPSETGRLLAFMARVAPRCRHHLAGVVWNSFR